MRIIRKNSILVDLGAVLVVFPRLREGKRYYAAANNTEAKLPRPKRWRRWTRFSLRTFLIFVTLAGVSLGWLGNVLHRVQQQRRIVAKIEKLGGEVNYSYEFDWPDDNTKPSPPGPKIVRWALGEDIFAYVDTVWLRQEISTNLAKDSDLEEICSLPELTLLSLDGPQFTDKGMSYVAKVPNLQWLILYDTQITSDGLALLSKCEHFEELSLSGANITDEMLVPLKRLDNLQRLQLFDTSVTSQGLAHVGKIISLRKLDIGVSISGKKSAIKSEGLQYLQTLENLEKLLLLNVSIDDEGMQYLRSLTKLKHLSLWGSSITDEGLETLKPLRKLIILDIKYTSVTDKGLKELLNFNELESLDLSGTKITDEGLIQIAKLKKLQWLHLSSTDVTDEGILQLRTLKNLEHLEVGPHVTKAAAEKLRESLPECTIVGWDKNGVNSFSVTSETAQ